jgi:group II intron reverse transcriptase/maturase
MEVCVMQNAEVVLTVLRKQSIKSKDFTFNRLYRNFFNLDFFMLAYSRIYAKEGNMTLGLDNKTIDGFNIEKVEKIIEKLKTETYYPKPSRRTYIPKKNGGTRPLGIPTLEDKLVQEILRMILEAIYEPSFKNTSHGFRPERSCHSALIQVKQKGSGTSWVIEGDIKGFFDNINHEIMLNIIKRKIKDGRIVELIRRFLKAGYFEFKKIHNSITGTPQGGIISPILANIYLNELDTFMEGVCLEESTTKSKKEANSVYRRLSWDRWEAKKNGKYKTANELLKKMRQISSVNPMDTEFIRINYVRYADDFLVLIDGNKELALNIKNKISLFLKENLKLELSEEKTLITHIRTERVKFLGYEIQKLQENEKVTKCINGQKKRSLNGGLSLLVPKEVIQSKIQKFTKNGKPIHVPERINDPVLNTLMKFNGEIRGLYNYYRLATDVSKKLYAFKHMHYQSLLKTIARKEKKSIKQILTKYGISVERRLGTGTRKIFGVTYQTKKEQKTMIYFNDPIRKCEIPYTGIERDGIVGTLYLPRYQILTRYNAKKCELCGLESTNQKIFEIHHIRKLKDIKQKYSKRGKQTPEWVLRMSALNRKTLVVCKKCHKKIHQGTMDKNLKIYS